MKKILSCFIIFLSFSNLAFANTTKLNILRVNREGIVPDFSSDIYKYYLTVPLDIDVLDIDAEADDIETNIDIIGNENLEDGLNLVKILLTSINGKQTSYEIEVSKTDDIESANSALDNLAIDGYYLEPAFDSNITKYFVKDYDNVNKLNVLAVPTDENARVDIDRISDRRVNVIVTAVNGYTKRIYEIDLGSDSYQATKTISNQINIVRSGSKQHFSTILIFAFLVLLFVVFFYFSKSWY